MPRTNFDTYAEEPAPQIDWFMAAILERMRVLKLNQKDLADAAHVSHDTMRKYMMRSPLKWPDDVRDNVCKLLGITVDLRKALS
jgi:hypothetical protein